MVSTDTDNRNGIPTRLEQAKSMIQRGMSFGDVYLYLLETDDERIALKDWYVMESTVPMNVVGHKTPNTGGHAVTVTGITRDGYGVRLETADSWTGNQYLPPPTLSQKSKEEGYSGDICVTCGSAKMVRTGTCQTCQDCYSTSGCG